jgi:hypothetical protein
VRCDHVNDENRASLFACAHRRRLAGLSAANRPPPDLKVERVDRLRFFGLAGRLVRGLRTGKLSHAGDSTLADRIEDPLLSIIDLDQQRTRFLRAEI